MENMSKISKSVRSLERRTVRLLRGQSYDRIVVPPPSSESEVPSYALRIPRKLSILKLRSRKVDSCISSSCSSSPEVQSSEEEPKPAKGGKNAGRGSRFSFFGRLREGYERLLVKAAAKSGQYCAVPVAKAARAPPALASSIDSWSLRAAVGSRKSLRVSDLNPGFEMTVSERKYMRHLSRTASCGRT